MKEVVSTRGLFLFVDSRWIRFVRGLTPRLRTSLSALPAALMPGSEDRTGQPLLPGACSLSAACLPPSLPPALPP